MLLNKQVVVSLSFARHVLCFLYYVTDFTSCIFQFFLHVQSFVTFLYNIFCNCFDNTYFFVTHFLIPIQPYTERVLGATAEVESGAELEAG